MVLELCDAQNLSGAVLELLEKFTVTDKLAIIFPKETLVLDEPNLP